jgi:general secretion pathway protein K
MAVRAAVNTSPPRHQRGVALLTALLIVAIVTSLSVYLAWDLSLEIRRSQDLIDQDRAYALCLSAEALATQTLAQNAKAHPGLIDLQQNWAHLPFSELGTQDIRISGHLEDLQGRLNLNGVLPGQPNAGVTTTRLARLLEHFQASPDLVDAVRDWIDSDNITTGTSGAEDGYYLGLNPPYRAANNTFVVPSSLRLVRGFEARLANELAPYIAALPPASTINVNTAPPLVLQALGLDTEQVQAVVVQRSQSPFTNVAQLLALPAIQGGHLDTTALGVTSHYFLLHVVATKDRARVSLYSILAAESGSRVKVLLRARNATP